MNTFAKIIQSLYEDKVAEKIAEDRLLKMSENYEVEQSELKDKAEKLKGSIQHSKNQMEDIFKFLAIFLYFDMKSIWYHISATQPNSPCRKITTERIMRLDNMH